MRSQRESRYNRVSHDGYDRVATLLPLRNTGPPTDVSGVLETLCSFQRPQPLFVPNLPSVAEQIRPNGREAPEHRETKQLPERRGPRGAANPFSPKPQVPPPPKRAALTPTPTSHSPQRRRGPQESAPARSPRGRRSRGIHQENVGEVTLTERVRFRNEVARKLMDLYDEAVELDECSDNMVAQLTDAMRADPRRAREVFGFVRLTPRPTDEQQAALDGVTEALATLRQSLVELVSTFLTADEKRHLGLDTNLFQTRAERATTYQYGAPQAARTAPVTTVTPASKPVAAASGEVGGRARRASALNRETPAASTADTTATAVEAGKRRSQENEEAMPSPVAHSLPANSPFAEASRVRQPPSVGSTNLAPRSTADTPEGLPAAPLPPSRPPEVRQPTPRAATPPSSTRHTDPQPPAAAEQEKPCAGEAPAEGADAPGLVGEGQSEEDVPVVRAPQPPPFEAPPLTHPAALVDSDADSSDEAVVTPERQQAPGSSRSLSSLDGGAAGASTSGQSPQRAGAPPVGGRAAIAPPSASPVPPPFAAGAKGAPMKMLVKKVPMRAVAKQMPFPMPMRKMPVQAPARPQAPQESGAAPPPSQFGFKSAMSAHTSGNGTANGTAALSAPAPLMTRPDFRRFMIDSDDSTA